MNLRPPGYEPPRLCTRVPPKCRLRARLTHRRCIWAEHGGIAAEVQCLQNACSAEALFVTQYGAELTSRFGQTIASTGSSEIGAVTGLEFLSNGDLEAAAEPVRRGGGDAEVVCPSGQPLPAWDHALCAPTPTG